MIEECESCYWKLEKTRALKSDPHGWFLWVFNNFCKGCMLNPNLKNNYTTFKDGEKFVKYINHLRCSVTKVKK